MNKNGKCFWLDVVLLVLFVLTVVSLFGQGQIATRVHYIAGTLLVIGSVVHVVWHWDWIKANVLRRRPRELGKKVRALRRIDLWLFLFYFLCSVSGLIFWPMEVAGLAGPIFPLERWGALHRWTGVMMFLVMIPHLGHHMKWLVCMARRALRPRAEGRQRLSEQRS
jgi:hypothetical protein